MCLHTEWNLMDRKVFVERKSLHCFLRLVVAHDDTRMELNAPYPGHWDLTDDIISRCDLESHDHNVT